MKASFQFFKAILSILFLLFLGACSSDENWDYSGPVGNWTSYGGTDFGERYSPLTQITKENVDELKIAWEYHTGDVSDGKGEVPTSTAFEATPILVDSTLYFPTPFNRIIALDPESGEERWTFDPQIDLKGFYANQLICRGVSYWKEDSCNAGNCDERILMATADSRLIAVQAKDGQPCKDFGNNGEIDLMEGMGETLWKGEYQITSPPAIAGNLAIVGSAVADNMRRDAPSGVVKAYDVRSGELVWSWDLRPPEGVIDSSLLSEGGYHLGSPNVWAPMSVDIENDLLFVPTGNPSPDYFGGLRNGLDYYGSSVVALRASTGEVVWNFQTVHHDLWDFDVPAQPTLTEVEWEGKKVPAVLQATKMGLIFTLNRLNGKPIIPVEERTVPQTTVPGEFTSPTQPYPTAPPPLIRHDLSKDDLWGPLGMSGDCEESFAKVHYEGAYTPPRLNQATLAYPGVAGGSNWGGIAFDKENQILVANVSDLPYLVTLLPNEAFEQAKKDNPGVEITPQTGTPYAMRREAFLSSLGLPCNAPPWGKLIAIDMRKGEILWQQPFGTTKDLAPVPIKLKYGVPNLGGPLITKSGIIFIAAALDNYIRAFDLKSGEMLWEERLPAGGQATPMTYRTSKENKQYLIIAAGGHGRGGSKLGDSVIAYALPE
ncbi:MAG: pyrroloquinoline quinone-dependent dehydrogenase [Bacteroidia bacterium]|nr:pyrroloquinoline quinone-dependent dehydrogenase [Bacteroidia bacterium]